MKVAANFYNTLSWFLNYPKGQLKERNNKGLPQGQLKKDLTSRLLALLLSPSYTLLVTKL